MSPIGGKILRYKLVPSKRNRDAFISDNFAFPDRRTESIFRPFKDTIFPEICFSGACF